MSIPQWITTAGNLGTIPEGIEYSFSLQATSSIEPVNYQLLAGQLPPGLQFSTAGLISGTPNDVAENVTSTFAVRATAGGFIADRTFSLTVSGQTPPRFITPAGNIGIFYDGTEVNIQLEYTDDDPGEIVRVRRIAGRLPPGLKLDSATGVISGIIQPLIEGPGSAAAGFDVSAFDQFPLDFTARASNQRYQFQLEVTDSKEFDIRTFDIFVYAKDSVTADSTQISADSGFVTADVTNERPPVLITASTDLGTVRADNQFAFKFDAVRFDGDPIEFFVEGAIPPGLQLDPQTGWLYGFLPDQSATELFYEFTAGVNKVKDRTLRVFLVTDLIANILPGYVVQQIYQVGQEQKIATGVVNSIVASNEIIVQQTPGDDFVEGELLSIRPPDSAFFVDGAVVQPGGISRFVIVPKVYVGQEWIDLEPKTFRVRVIGDIETEVMWQTPQDLGTIQSGNPSDLSVFAVAALGRVLNYQIVEGSLPPGLELLSTGELAGTVSSAGQFFNNTYSFTVNAFTQDGFVSTFREFFLTVDYVDIPSLNIYVKAMPPLEDRQLVADLLTDTDVIYPETVYRAGDPNFGIADDVVYMHAYGLSPLATAQYLAALEQNHYDKNILLGPIQVAQALDDQDIPVYEVVYSSIVDDLVNTQGISIPDQIRWPRPLQSFGVPAANLLYPNSLANMRNRLRNTIGFQRRNLPLWMTSKQKDGKILGFISAWPIVYVQPGHGEATAYRIRQSIGNSLNVVDFKIDRYTVDNRDTQFWDFEIQDWDPPGSANEIENVNDERLDKYLKFPARNILG